MRTTRHENMMRFGHGFAIQSKLANSPPRKLKSLFLACAIVVSPAALAGATIKTGDDSSISLGFGLRTSYTHLENGAANGTSYSNDFELDNARIYIGGQLNKYIKGTFNTERKADGGIQVMDAIAQFEYNNAFNVWAGRMLPPSDRANLDGPFYLYAWDYPGVVSNYPNLAVGRDNGVTVWGKVLDKQLTYAVGSFKGHNNLAAASNTADNLLYTGRLAYSFWGPEPAPAYYTGSTYYGVADILTVGLVGMYQKDGVGVPTAKGNFRAWNIDALMEKKLGGIGVLDLEGAYYKYDLGALDCGTGEPGSPACPAASPTDNVGGQVKGTAYMVGAALLLPDKVGSGQFQPFTRYQKFNRSVSDTDKSQFDAGVNYVIAGANAKIAAQYSKIKDSQIVGTNSDLNRFILGVQVQY